MAPPTTLVLESTSNLDSLKTCSPYLMPFHIDYSGLAPISTYLRVNAAKETVGAPPPPEDQTNDPPSITTSNDAGLSSTTDSMSVSTEENPVSDTTPSTESTEVPPPTLIGRVTDATTRFISSFRGRTIQGLKVALPPGYVGVVLNTANPGKEKERGQLGKSNSRNANIVGKGKESLSKRRITRSKTYQEEADEEQDISMVVDADKADGGGLLLDDEATRTLSISSQFSSFILWHADHPVDESRDEYVRSLTEWTRLARLIHQTEDDLT